MGLKQINNAHTHTFTHIQPTISHTQKARLVIQGLTRAKVKLGLPYGPCRLQMDAREQLLASNRARMHHTQREARKESFPGVGMRKNGSAAPRHLWWLKQPEIP